jgi:transcriptional regulator with XRE-family HTH domain
MIGLDVEELYLALDRARRGGGLRWRDIAREAGVSPSTLTRIGQGKRPDADGLIRLMVWLGTPNIGPYIAHTS